MPPQPAAMRSRWAVYAGISTLLAGGVILKSLAQRPNFYSAAVYLSQSSANLMILCNLVLVTACSIVLSLQKILYGPLRPIEVEQLYEKAWFAVTETCLAMTIFRGEIGAWFLVMFFSLLAGKVWGWIGEGRVEVLEQQQHNVLAGRNARFFHTRLALSLALSVLFDMTMLEYVVGQVLHMARPDMMVMFGFEFAVLTITSLSTAMRYALNLVEIGVVRAQKQKRMEAIRKERVDAAVREVQEQQTPEHGEQATEGQQTPGPDLAQRRTQAAQEAASQPIDEADVEVEGWEGKGRWTFYLDLTTDFFKLVVYLSFFFILLIFYGLPLHIMRDVFLTCRSFFKRIGDFLRYRTATRDMNERYPDATEAEIGREDVCIICREEMRTYVPPAQGAAVDPMAERMRPKKLPCGHVLHFSCLRSWLERQQICPTCRATVVPPTQVRPGAPAAPAVAGRAQHPQHGGNGRPRVYQLGPLRIGVGAARGNNMLEELEQQLANANLPPVQAQNGAAPQQYGFGIRWDGLRRRAQGQHRQVRGTVPDQLDAAERQIQRELDSLQASMGELQALRNIQAQMNSVRMARQQQQGTPATAAVPGVTLRPSLPLPLPGQAGAQVLHGNGQGVLQAGSDQLPSGLTLPEGWSMMPLQQMPGPQVQGPAVFAMPMPVPAQFHTPPPHMAPNNIGQPIPGTQNLPPQNLDPVIQEWVRQSQEAARSALAQLQASQVLNATQTPQSSEAGRESTQADLAQTRESLGQLAGNLGGAVQNAASTDIDGRPASNGETVASTPNAQHSASTVSAASSQVPPRSIQQPAAIPRPQPPSSPSNQAQSRLTPSSRSTSATSHSNLRPTPISTPSSILPSTTPQRSNAVPNPLQRLAPTAQANGNHNSSPHRANKSIGSSWGFTDEQKKEGTDSDEDEDDDSDDEQNLEAKAGATTKPNAKGKIAATVEDDDDSDDPD